MSLKKVLSNSLAAAFFAFLITLGFILREYFTDGVITHHLLARDDLPGFTNWLGLVTVPLLFIIGSILINKRLNKPDKQDEPIVSRFLIAFIFGLTISICWALDLEIILPYFILLPLVVAIVKPVHFPECLMGFVIGMLFSFGGILPIIIGTVLLILSFLIHVTVTGIKKLLVKKT